MTMTMTMTMTILMMVMVVVVILTWVMTNNKRHYHSTWSLLNLVRAKSTDSTMQSA
jgi:uncharacterized ion transporter superfamily protein YfcC